MTYFCIIKFDIAQIPWKLFKVYCNESFTVNGPWIAICLTCWHYNTVKCKTIHVAGMHQLATVRKILPFQFENWVPSLSLWIKIERPPFCDQENWAPSPTKWQPPCIIIDGHSLKRANALLPFLFYASKFLPLYWHSWRQVLQAQASIWLYQVALMGLKLKTPKLWDQKITKYTVYYFKAMDIEWY